MLTVSDIRRILIEGRTLPGVEDADEHTEIVIDSFSLAWLQHSLRTEHGIQLDLRDVRAEDFSTITRIKEYVNALVRGHEVEAGDVR